jgi:hypothetical protein
VTFDLNQATYTPMLVVAESKSPAPEMLAESPTLILEAVNDFALLLAELPTAEVSGNETDDESAA